MTATQRSTPFGSVRAGGGLPTTIGFTGQRQDGTGLLFYNARYYDPSVGQFVSADTIAPKKEDPQSRNRYSYVKNNPPRYTDSTGHCWDIEGSGDYDDLFECERYEELLDEHAIGISRSDRWKLSELQALFGAVKDLYNAFNWTVEHFRELTGGNIVAQRINGPGPCDDRGCTVGEHYGDTNIIAFYDGAFGSGELYAKAVVVHEIAHVIDGFSGNQLSNNLRRYTGGHEGAQCPNGYCPGDERSMPSDYARTNAAEDFAESVASTLYPDAYGINPERWTARNDYVWAALFCPYDVCAP